jgi:hypothetical protein
MKVFIVKIGKKTRSGNIQELITRCVSVHDEATTQDLYKYFFPRYKGFCINIEQPECEVLPDFAIEYRPPKTELGKKQGSLAFRIKYNDDEKELFKEYIDHVKKANQTEDRIEKSIRERYRNLPYVNFRYGNGSMILKTDTNGTFCESLLIKSNDFFKVVKDCDDGTMELEITTETEEPEVNSDIPF